VSFLQRLNRRSLSLRGSSGPRALACLLLLLSSAVGVSCAEEAITVPVRSLERSGRVSFVCLGAPSAEPPGLSLTTCTRAQSDSPNDYRFDENGKPTLPHLYAMTTQTTRGEVAVVDLTAANNSVLDLDARKPGANFLPVGAQPADIVSTPGGTATFVAVAEVGRQGIYALPSSMIRACPDCPVPTLTSWPACALPSTPGAMILVNDPADENDMTRASCDGAYGGAAPAPAANETPGAHGDLVKLEKVGRQKLLVTLPDLGGFAVIDAQRLLDRNAGTFGDCPIERWVPLDAVEIALPGGSGGSGGASGVACIEPEEPEPGALTSYSPRPSGLAVSGKRLYLGDLEAPVIHEIDLPTPCEPVARPPLLVSSAEDPSRVVTTSRLAASAGLTSDLRRFLYAVDYEDGSTMIFDITDDGGERAPLRRPNPQFNPFQPIDRLRFAAPARDVIIVERDAPLSHPATGVAPSGTRCDPDPTLLPCTVDAQSCDVETLYRTSADFQTGAGPQKLRGMFAFIMLSTGAIVVIDIDDLDAACRGPLTEHPLFGCDSAGPQGAPLVTSGEPSCNVVVPHTPRQAAFLLSNDSVGRHQPGIQIFPLLTDRNGTAITLDDDASPMMRAPLPPPENPVSLGLAVGGGVLAIDPSGDPLDPPDGVIKTDDGPKHTLVMNFEDPRAQVGDQLWTVTYEGGIPGFSGKFAELLIDGSDDGLIDVNSRFCDAGVQSRAMVRELLEAEGVPAAELDAVATGRADRVQIVNELPAQDDIHWSTAGATAEDPAPKCTFQFCETTFGSQAVPQLTRDLIITEAFQGRLALADSTVKGNGTVEGDALIKCCFPSATEFRVHASGQWIVLGEGTGFLHHVIADPDDGRCRNSCDPNRARMNGRILENPADEPVQEGSPFVFRNPMFRFAITPGSAPSERDYQFRFVTQSSFPTMVIPLSTETTDLQPQAITFLPSTGELVVTDGQLEGLILVGVDSLRPERQYF
jgi:hypothetical protein